MKEKVMLKFAKIFFKRHRKDNEVCQPDNIVTDIKPDYPGPCAAFLSGEEADCGTIERFIDFSYDQLENSHSYIQYVFPTKEPSMYNSKAPVLTDKEIEWIRSDAGIQARSNLESMFLRMINFYGFTYFLSPESVSLQRSDFFDERSKVWLTPGNHNYKRLTRILKSLMLCGLEDDARKLYKELEKTYADYEDIIGAESFEYWKNAVDAK